MQLVIGHTTETTTRIWVRGNRRYRTVAICLDERYDIGSATSPRVAGHQQHPVVHLRRDTDYTAVVNFEQLSEDTEYQVVARFSPSVEHMVRGGLRTLKRQTPGKEFSFSFVLVSCNLSVVSINNLGARLLAMAGAALARRSLERPTHTWSFPHGAFAWTRKLCRGTFKSLLFLVMWFVGKATGAKQPGRPYMRSPFVKLSAALDSTILCLKSQCYSVGIGDVLQGTISGARGVVASINNESPTEEDSWRLVLTQVTGRFTETEQLTLEEGAMVGRIAAIRPAKSWFDRPDFFIHAGDQIYYDFPDASRPPAVSEYRLAYREAWFDDDAQCYVLSHWPHYMTLDDHEIADQFARDFAPPADGFSADDYRQAASSVYREYVHKRNPSDGGHKPAGGAYDYTFSRGLTRFFVLDTRTQRETRAGEIIDCRQLSRLLKWMWRYRDDLKFIVTSVPFVAEMKGATRQGTDRDDVADWYSGKHRQRVRSDDAWCAPAFRGQRERVIDFVRRRRIERLVFLTGDVHCCYHATMRIGQRSDRIARTIGDPGPRYEAVTIHELGSGPVNQLQLGRRRDFDVWHTGQTARGIVFHVNLDRFHGEANAVMHVRVKYVERDRVVCRNQEAGTNQARHLVPEVEWNVVRTLTDPGLAAFAPCESGGGEQTMVGRISFCSSRTRSEIATWV